MISSNLDANFGAGELERVEAANLDSVIDVEGTCELRESLTSDGWTLVTSGTRSLAEGRMVHLSLLMPERFVTADDVSSGKPYPEAHLKGAEILSARPEFCVVIDDAPSRIRAARAAGMRVVALAMTYPPKNTSELTPGPPPGLTSGGPAVRGGPGRAGHASNCRCPVSTPKGDDHTRRLRNPGSPCTFGAAFRRREPHVGRRGSRTT